MRRVSLRGVAGIIFLSAVMWIFLWAAGAPAWAIVMMLVLLWLGEGTEKAVMKAVEPAQNPAVDPQASGILHLREHVEQRQAGGDGPPGPARGRSPWMPFTHIWPRERKPTPAPSTEEDALTGAPAVPVPPAATAEATMARTAEPAAPEPDNEMIQIPDSNQPASF